MFYMDEALGCVHVHHLSSSSLLLIHRWRPQVKSHPLLFYEWHFNPWIIFTDKNFIHNWNFYLFNHFKPINIEWIRNFILKDSQSKLNWGKKYNFVDFIKIENVKEAEVEYIENCSKDMERLSLATGLKPLWSSMNLAN